MSLDFDFYIFLESLEQKEADCTCFAKKFCKQICTDAFAYFQFSLNIILVCEKFANILHIWILRGKAFQNV